MRGTNPKACTAHTIKRPATLPSDSEHDKVVYQIFVPWMQKMEHSRTEKGIGLATRCQCVRHPLSNRDGGGGGGSHSSTHNTEPKQAEMKEFQGKKSGSRTFMKDFPGPPMEERPRETKLSMSRSKDLRVLHTATTTVSAQKRGHPLFLSPAIMNCCIHNRLPQNRN